MGLKSPQERLSVGRAQARLCLGLGSLPEPPFPISAVRVQEGPTATVPLLSWVPCCHAPHFSSAHILQSPWNRLKCGAAAHGSFMSAVEASPTRALLTKWYATVVYPGQGGGLLLEPDTDPQPPTHYAPPNLRLWSCTALLLFTTLLLQWLAMFAVGQSHVRRKQACSPHSEHCLWCCWYFGAW